jgi:hypothetical protein
MKRGSRELWLALFAIITITAFYLVMVILLGGIPAASDFFGHSLGVLGFVLMLMTETLYTLRKRSRSARWGRVSSWMQFHIFTGLVGPYLVLLHTSWKFNGLAGILMLMTVVVVTSGFIGRYIYTAVPRTADGIEVESAALEQQLGAAEKDLKHWLAARPDLVPVVDRRLKQLSYVPANSFELFIGQPVTDWGGRLDWWFDKRKLSKSMRTQVTQLEVLLERRRRLYRQTASLAQARRFLATWHAVHIPLGVALFTAAFIHIGAAIYYATLLR